MSRVLINTVCLAKNVDAVGAQQSREIDKVENAAATFQATNNGSGTTTVVDIEVSNDKEQWIVMGTISLSTNDETDGFVSNAPWKHVRANVKTLTAGAVTVTMGG